MVPEMSGLQYLVVRLLFAGPQSGAELRRRFAPRASTSTRPRSRGSMQRMEDAGYLQAETEAGAERLPLGSPVPI